MPPPEPDPNIGSGERESERLWRLAGMGGTLASEIVAGALIGWVLDRILGTGPTLLIALTIVGIVVGMVTFIRGALRESGKSGRTGAAVAARHAAQAAEAREEDDGDDHGSR